MARSEKTAVKGDETVLILNCKTYELMLKFYILKNKFMEWL